MRNGRRYQSTENALNGFRERLRSEPLNLRTRTFYYETAHAVLKLMEAVGLHTLPHEITVEDVRRLLDCFDQQGLAVATRKGYLSALKKYLSLLGYTETFENISYRLPQDIRPCVEWYTPEQAKLLLDCDKSTLQSLVIHCELCLGMRRVEIIRLRTMDIHDVERYIDVRGKGPAGGKLRSIPFAKDTDRIMHLALDWRAEMICDSVGEIPDNLILWKKARRLHAYSEEGDGLDKAVTRPLTERLGFRVTNHKGRRTFGRTLYRAGVAVPTIAKILGHDSTEVTLRYIGVDLDDMRSAMEVQLYA